MKKIFTFIILGAFALGFGQYYPNDDYYGNESYDNNGWYDDGNSVYFPDDYYYDYPSDYYGNDYYQSMYNDYRNSIVSINWNRFFAQVNLSTAQINLIINLNRQFPSYAVWNSYYRVNPVRWYYDRFYALRQILGPALFVIFQNDFYDGYSPVIYYTNYWRNYYRPRFNIAPRYRNMDINRFRIDRNDFHYNNGNNFGWNQPRNSNRGGYGFRENSGRNTTPGMRNDSYRNNNGNVSSRIGTESRGMNGMRNDVYRGNTSRSEQNMRNSRSSSPLYRIMQNRSSRNNSQENARSQGNMRSSQPQMRNNNSQKSLNNSKSRSEGRKSGGERSQRNSSGMRFATR